MIFQSIRTNVYAKTRPKNNQETSRNIRKEKGFAQLNIKCSYKSQ
jgi:hypothetical protein